MSEVYVPKLGERVRVVAVCPLDPNPHHRVGDVFEAGESCEANGWGVCYGYAYVHAKGTAAGTWARVQPEPPADAAPEPAPMCVPAVSSHPVPVFDASLVRPASISDAVVAACEAEAASVRPSKVPTGCVLEGAGLPVTIEQAFDGRVFLNDCAEDAPPAEAVNPKEVAASGEARIPWQCLPVRPLVGAALAMGEGAHKYGRHNYRKMRIKSSVYFDALLRHFFAWWEGEDIDPDSGLHHIDKAIACLLVLRDAQLRGMSDDDRPPVCETGWIKAAGNVFGEMRKRLTAQFGEPKPAARADG